VEGCSGVGAFARRVRGPNLKIVGVANSGSSMLHNVGRVANFL